MPLTISFLLLLLIAQNITLLLYWILANKEFSLTVNTFVMPGMSRFLIKLSFPVAFINFLDLVASKRLRGDREDGSQTCTMGLEFSRCQGRNQSSTGVSGRKKLNEKDWVYGKRWWSGVLHQT